MDTPKREASTLQISSLLILVSAIGGYLWYQPPLKTARPNHELVKQEAGEQRVAARLWQDPFMAAEEHLQSEKAAGPPPATEHHTMQDLIGETWRELGVHPVNVIAPKVPVITVLLTMVEGSPYSEGSEQRIRIRYAIGSGLSVACLVPQDSENIRYFDWPIIDTQRIMRVPAEWYRASKLRTCDEYSEGQPARHVLVLWLKDELISDDPVPALRTLTEELHREFLAAWEKSGLPSTTDEQLAQWVSYKIIGPAGSTTLRRMVEKAEGNSSTPSQKIRWPNANGAIELISPWATASPELLLARQQGHFTNEQKDNPAAWMQSRLHDSAKVELVRTIGSDYELAQTLLHELARRGRKIAEEKHAVALVSEWDTFYGRTLPVEFTAAVCAERECDTHADALELFRTAEELDRRLPWVRRYSYLRGLDGEVPAKDGGKSDRDKKPAREGKEKDFIKDWRDTVEYLERPDGQSQLDYVRRLVQRMEMDAPTGGFKAIGILGSDMYDKLLILQALRKSFPSAIFFTTDLDARLLHRAQHEWTHNLLVATHYDLFLNPRLQRNVPPFRDSYQTATFVAVLRAMDSLKSIEQLCLTIGAASATSCPQKVLIVGTRGLLINDQTPKLYEIGRTKAIPLDVGNAEADGASIHPAAVTSFSEEEGTSLIALLPLAVSSVVFILLRLLMMWRYKSERYSLIVAGSSVSFIVTLWMVEHFTGFWASASWPSGTDTRWWGASLVILGMGLFVLALPLLQTLSKDKYRLFRDIAILGGVSLYLILFTFVQISRLPGQEPFYWLEGVSVWPSEFIRIAAATLGFAFLFLARHDLNASMVELTNQFGLGAPTPSVTSDEPPKKPSWRDWVTPSQWSAQYTQRHLGSLWEAYRLHTEYKAHRIWPQVVLFGGLGFAAIYIFERPNIPFRGDAGWWLIDTFALAFSVPMLLLLMFFVVDATCLCSGFIKGVSAIPEIASVVVAARHPVRLIAERTKVVSNLIYYPCIVLSLMIVARSKVFDNWDIPIALLLVWGLSAAYAIGCAVMLSRASEQARSVALAGLRAQLFHAKGGGESKDNPEQIELTIKAIESENEGAFVHWTQHPVLRAVLVPSGGFSIAALIEYVLSSS